MCYKLVGKWSEPGKFLTMRFTEKNDQAVVNVGSVCRSDPTFESGKSG